MTITAVIEIDADQFTLGEVFAHHGVDVRVELTQFVPMNGYLVPFCWVDAGTTEERDAFERTVQDDSRIAGFTRLDEAVGRALYRIEWETEMDGFLTALRGPEIMVERAVTPAGSDNWTFHLQALDRDAMVEFQRTCVEEGVQFTVRRISHDQTRSTDRYGLSDKQRQALMLAFNKGYFRVPREISLSELAALAEISRQAYSRRLDRALQTYLTETGIQELDSE